MRKGRAFPFCRPHQDFAIAAAIIAMKFVDRHEQSLVELAPQLKLTRKRSPTAPALSDPIACGNFIIYEPGISIYQSPQSLGDDQLQ